MHEPKGLNPYQRHSIKRAMELIEQICAKDTAQLWERHALRAAFFALDAIWRQDIGGVGYALKAVETSMEVQYGQTRSS